MSVNWEDWGNLLSLAKAFGWKPAGMIRNPDPGDPFTLLGRPECDDSLTLPSARFEHYISNDGNMVTAADARALAGAIEKALAHPEQPAVKRFLEPTRLEFEVAGKGKFVIEETEHEIREWARKFIEYCRAGRFIVW